MKKFITPLLFSIIICINSCKEDEPVSTEKPYVNFINAVTETGINQGITAVVLDTLTFKEKQFFGSGSVPRLIPIGNHPIIFTQGSTAGASVFTGSYNFKGGKNISLIMCNKSPNIEFLPVENNIKLSSDTLGSVKFINLSPGTFVNITINSNTITNLGFKAPSQVFELVPGVENPISVTSSSFSKALGSPKFKVQKGKSWIVVIAGEEGTVNAPDLKFIAIN